MKYTIVSSSSVEAVGYDEAQHTLGVKYLRGTEYHYYDVSKNVFDSLLSADSKGRFLNIEIKQKGYRYIQIS